MRRRSWGITCAALTLLAALRAGAASAADSGGTQSVFSYGAGNRALAMGGAFSAVGDDASALIWNPAGLGRLRRAEFQATEFGDPSFGVHEFYGAFAVPSWRLGTFGIVVRHFGTGGIERRDDQNILLSTDLTDSETELTLGYGRSFGDAWSVGAGAKLRRHSLGGFAASGIGMDVGVDLSPAALLHVEDSWAGGLRLGLSVRNAIEPSLRLDRESVADPAAIRSGFAYRIPLRAGWLVASADLEKAPAVETRLHAGLEVVAMQGAAARLGLDAGRLTAGLGMRWHDLSFDYAFMDAAVAADHRVGLTFHLGPTVEASRATARKAEDDTLQSRLADAFRRRQAEQVDELLDRAGRDREAGRLDHALVAIGALRTLAPDDPRVTQLERQCLLDKAAALEGSGDFAAAAMAYELAAQGRGADSLTATRAAHCRTESDRRARRKVELREGFARALEAFARDDLAAARAGFAAVLASDSSDADARAMLRGTAEAARLRAIGLIDQATSAIAAGALDEARALIDQATSLDADAPGLAAARASLGRARPVETVESRAGDRPPARDARRSEVRMSDSEAEDLYRRGLDATRRGRPDEALRYWEIIWSARSDYRGVAELIKREYLARGMEDFAAGRLENAVTQWQNVLRVDPNDARARGYLARARQQIARSREILGASP